MSVRNRIALVTGAASGIGAEVARQLSAAGARVALCDVNETAGAALAAELGGEFIACDVSRFEAVEALSLPQPGEPPKPRKHPASRRAVSICSMKEAVEACIERLGVPDYAHLNAGIMTVPTNDAFLAIEAVSVEQYRRILSVNLDGVFHGVKALLPLMREKGGAITITASVAGFGSLAVDPLYSATKHALIGLGRSVAAANEGGSLRINVICPGVVDTAIVPDSFRGPEFGVMPPSMMAAEVVDLLTNGTNGEVRVKLKDRPGFAVAPVDLQA